jgi:hypothetical protein
MTDDIRAGVISYEATYQVRLVSDTRPGVISFESIRPTSENGFILNLFLPDVIL